MIKKDNVYSIPEQIARTAKTLEEKGFEAYLVGGCVRDIILGLKPKDWDITTNAKPEEIIASFQKTFYENEYGTVGVVNEDTDDESLKVIEITPFRTETGYSNKRHPDKVFFGSKLDEDLERRDFTINAIALSLKDSLKDNNYKGHLIDLHGGCEDLTKKSIKTVGEPDKRFDEDALRILRAIRLASELDFTINTDTLVSMSKNAPNIKLISAERIRDEFVRIISSNNPSKGLGLALKIGVLDKIIPELVEALNVKQNQAHSFDVLEHLVRSLQHAADRNWSLEIRLASLLHDIGKPKSRQWSEEKKDWTFYGHDMIGAKMATKILQRLMFPKKVVDDVAKLIRWHMFFSDTDQITLSSVRRLLSNVGRENIWDLMNLRACDRIGTGRPKENPYRLRKYKAMIEEVMHDPISVGMLKIDGLKIMELTKINPGPKIGHILHILLDEVIENPSLNTAEILEKKALELAKIEDEKLNKIGKKAKDKKEEEENKAIQQIRDKYWVK